MTSDLKNKFPALKDGHTHEALAPARKLILPTRIGVAAGEFLGLIDWAYSLILQKENQDPLIEKLRPEIIDLLTRLVEVPQDQILDRLRRCNELLANLERKGTAPEETRQAPRGNGWGFSPPHEESGVTSPKPRQMGLGRR